MIKPVKVIFEMEQANPHLVIIEIYSQPISCLKPLTAQMARNILTFRLGRQKLDNGNKFYKYTIFKEKSKIY